MTRSRIETTTRTIGKREVLVARKKKSKPTAPRKGWDPAELARIEAETRKDPSRWGVNDDTTKGAQGSNVVTEAATRTKVARIYRYDAFGILFSRGGLGHDQKEAAALLQAVRRFETAMAQRMRLEGTTGQGGGSSQPIPISDRSLMAARELDHVQAAMTPFLWGLLVELVKPSVANGQPSNNWRKDVDDYVRKTCGMPLSQGKVLHRVEQASHVRACAENLLGAWQAWDNRQRRAA